MVDQIIRPSALPNRANPNPSEKVPVDNGSSVGGATIEALVLSGRPTATRLEAEAGTDAVKAMTPLTTKQAIDAQVPPKINSAISSLNLDSVDLSFDDRATAAARDLSAFSVVNVNRWDGSSAVAPATYSKIDFEPDHAAKFQSLDGSWWSLVDLENLRQIGAVGDGLVNDTAAMQRADAWGASPSEIDMLGRTYLVNTLPVRSTFVDGYWKLSDSAIIIDQRGTTIPSDDTPGIISGITTTGAFGSAYTGGANNTPTVPGRTNRNLRAILACQSCRADFARSVNIGSIYSWAYGNVSGNYSSRQSVAGAPQAVNIASEEGQIYGFGGLNANVHFSRTDGTKCTNIGTRLSEAGGARYNGNIFSNTSRAGGGWGAIIVPTFTDGTVSAMTIQNGGLGYDTTQIMSLMARGLMSTTDAQFTFTVDGSGTITSITITDPGSGYVVGQTYDVLINYPTESTGEACGNFATITSTVKGKASANVGTTNSVNLSQNGFIAASSTANTSAIGSSQVILGSVNSATTGGQAVVIAGNQAFSDHDAAMVLGRRVRSALTRTLVTGDATSGSASTANRTFQVAMQSGNVTARGTFTGSTVFTDYAEFFENEKKGVIDLGVLVSLSGRKVRPAKSGDDILGVISATALIVAGDSPFTWSQRYMTGEFGEPMYHEIPDPDWEEYVPDPFWPKQIANPEHPIYEYDEDNKPALTSEAFLENPRPAPLIANPVAQPLVVTMVENPDYDPDRENIPRSERPKDWSCVGLLGQVHVRVKSNVQPGDWIEPFENGIGAVSEGKTNMRCMEIRRTYDDTKGYAVAFCLIR